MKIRNGFISNSSTSSFCLVGWEITELSEDHWKKMIREIRPDLPDLLFANNEERAKRIYMSSYTDESESSGGRTVIGYEIEGPIDEGTKMLNEIQNLTKKLELPAPSIFSGSFYH